MTTVELYSQAAARLTELEIPFEENALLAPLTTFRIGGPAALLCRPNTVQQVQQLLEVLRECGIRWYCLGRGSNTLFADEGFAGAVLWLGGLTTLKIEENILTAQAGVSLMQLCRGAQAAGLAGLEFAYGIPGSVGGAVYMNAGAYHGEISQVVGQVTSLQADGRLKVRSLEECKFSYRHSIFAEENSVVLEARFVLHPGLREEIQAKMEGLMAQRKAKQPLEYPSAGSTFKRPEGAFAAALIDECGLKGLSVGGAQISTKHAGFVINTGSATCADVLALTDEVARIVQEKTGYRLEKEIRVVR